ncbi:OLC1v1003287C1 [Oldenlandia corymbosa var. corymbosa]|uniref:OLC1v1003287C1 n=1 Tax=Oldenlandia corymbosa var. corymbosa TaxID=529605 RepID=A0AAV1DAH6_OLDCO|nr:OLC1v1003287C1 [Oldenlandia corymbosa var. corymbosa]
MKFRHENGYIPDPDKPSSFSEFLAFIPKIKSSPFHVKDEALLEKYVRKIKNAYLQKKSEKTESQNAGTGNMTSEQISELSSPEQAFCWCDKLWNAEKYFNRKVDNALKDVDCIPSVTTQDQKKMCDSSKQILGSPASHRVNDDQNAPPQESGGIVLSAEDEEHRKILEKEIFYFLVFSDILDSDDYDRGNSPFGCCS